MDERLARRFLEERGYGVVPPEQYLSDVEEPFLRHWERVVPFTMTSPNGATPSTGGYGTS